MTVQNKLNLFLTSILFLFGGLSHADSPQIKPLPHQKMALDFLDSHPDQRGLLLYHALGSGKTLTSLMFAKKQKMPLIVIAPEVLKSHWISEAKKLDIKSDQFKFLSINRLSEVEKISASDFSKSLVIVDEIQRLIEKVRLSPSSKHMDAYWSINKSKRLLLLTGTPVYNDAADIGYIGNLLVGKEIFPYHPGHFRAEYMDIIPQVSLARGYMLESKLFTTFFPIFTTFVGTSLSVFSGSPWFLILSPLVGVAGINELREQFPISLTNFRKFNASKFSDFAQSNISYYQVADQSEVNYPEVKVENLKVAYTTPQVEFFLKFIDGVLNREQLSTLLRDEGEEAHKVSIDMHSDRIQKAILNRPDAGREIGNLTLNEANIPIIPNKFIALRKYIEANEGKTAIYSSYYNNGILELAEYLRVENISFEILEANAPSIETGNVIERFNSGKNKILLIHPEITEGISLVGVEQLHILEPVKNIATEKQIIGRTARYQSHIHLPKHRQRVNVFVWESEVNYSKLGIPTDAGLVRKQHWRNLFSEINPNLWTGGIIQLDRNYFRKEKTPDAFVAIDKNSLSSDMQSFQNICKERSVEREPTSTPEVDSQKASLFSSPILEFSMGRYPSYKLSQLKNGKTTFDVKEQKSYQFGIEIPALSSVNIGFGLKCAGQKLLPKLDIEDLDQNERNLKGLDLDFSIYSRSHVEFESFSKLSLFWKNDWYLNSFAYAPTLGLGLGSRQSLGAKILLTQTIGVGLELGIEARILRDFVSQIDDIQKNEELKKYFNGFKAMKSVTPYISASIFSAYW